MNEESKAIAAERMRRYWDEVRSGKRQHKSRGPVKSKPQPEPEKVEPVVQTQPEPVVQPPKKEPISPIARAEGIHFPMPGMKPEISFMLDPQQPVEQKTRHVDAPVTPPKNPELKKVFDQHEQENETRQIVGDKNLNLSSKVNLVVGRKVPVKFQRPEPKTGQKVIMQFGRRARNPGDL